MAPEKSTENSRNSAQELIQGADRSLESNKAVHALGKDDSEALMNTESLGGRPEVAVVTNMDGIGEEGVYSEKEVAQADEEILTRPSMLNVETQMEQHSPREDFKINSAIHRSSET